MDIQNWIGLQTEADLKEYKVYKKKDSPNYSYLTTTTSTTYTDNSEEAVTGPYVANETVAYYKIVAVDKSNYVSPYSNEVSSRVEGEAQSKQSWAGNSSAPDNFSLTQNYPNPFNPATKILYTVPEESRIQIKIYNTLGVEIAELVNDYKAPGTYEETFSAVGGLASGVYIYRLLAYRGDRILFTATKQMALLK